jgi:hypothetical protein
MHCEICCWYDAETYFDEEEYYKSNLQLLQLNGYNTVININGYNRLYVCNECLIQRVYVCDTELKREVLHELRYSIASKIIQKWWLKRLYCIDTRIGKCFIYNHLSTYTKNYFNIVF